MKNFTRVVAVVLALLVSGFTFAQDYIEVGSGVGTTSYVPFYGFYNYSWSAEIVEQAELGFTEPVLITAIAYNVATSPTNYSVYDQTVYLGHKSESQWTSGSYNDPATMGYTQVFDGDLVWNGSGWHMITFDEPFLYDAENNLVIQWENRDGSWASGGPRFYYTEKPDHAKYRYSDAGFPTDPGNINVYGTNVRIYYQPTSTNASLNGTVADVADNEPISSAKVILDGGRFTYTDADGFYSFSELYGGNHNVVVEKVGYSTFSGTVQVAGSGVTTYDIALTEVMPAPVGVYAELIASNVVDISWGAASTPYEIVYDDGVAENYAVWVQGGNLNALKFLPPGYPCKVTAGSVYVGDGTYPPGNDPLQPFFMAVYDDNGENGLPGSELLRIEVIPDAYGWVSFDFGEEAVTFEEGEFYLAMVQGGNYPECLALGVDETNPSFRSYQRFATGGQGWLNSGFNDFMIRAICEGPAGVANLSYEPSFIEPSRISEGHRFLNVSENEFIGGFETLPVYKATSKESSSDRSFQNYTVWRLLYDAMDDPSSWVLLGNTTNLNYRDNAWPNLPSGGYRWAVAANYSAGQSTVAFSNILGNDWEAELTINVSLSSGENPAGAYVTLVNKDGLANHVYEGAVDETGTIVFPAVWKGEYELTVTKFGYDNYQGDHSVYSDMTIDVELMEVLNPPLGLVVDPATLHASWLAPGVDLDLFTEDFESGSFATNEWTFAPTQGNWGITGSGNPGSAAKFNWSPSQSNYSFALVSKEFSGLGFPNMFFSFDLMLNNYSTSTLEEMTVEVFDGTTWHEVAHFDNAAGSINWENHLIDISAHAVGNNFKVRFVAHGANTFNINHWDVDNVMLYGSTDGDNRAVTAYAFHLNEGTLTATTASGVTYYDIDPWMVNWGQTYTSSVRAIYNNGYSEPSLYTWTSAFLEPPRELEGEAQGHYAHLTWEKPFVEVPAPVFEGTIPTVTVTEQTSSDFSLGLAPGTSTGTLTKEPDVKMLRGSLAYATDAINDIFGTIDVDTPGVMTQITATTGAFFCGDFGVEDENAFYVINNDNSQLSYIDVTTGEFTLVGTVAGGVGGDTWTGMAMDKNTGIMYASSTNGAASTLYTINLETAEATVIGAPAIAGIIDIAINGNGVLYATDIISDNSFTINKETAEATELGALGINLNYAQGLGWDPATGTVYIAAYTTEPALYILDEVTGAAALVGAFPAGSEICAFGFPGGGASGGIDPGNVIAYNIYKDGAFYAVADTIPPLEHTTEYLVAGWHQFTVTAVYGEPTPGESGPALPAPVDIYILGEGTIAGTVSQCGNTPRPIEGAMITVVNVDTEETYVTYTGANGQYSVDVLEATYNVTCEAEGFVTQNVENVMVPDETTITLDFEPCEFPYPVVGVTATRNFEHTECFVDWYAPTFFETIAYDDGIADDVTAWDVAGNINAVKFTPTGYPCEVTGGSVNIYDGSWPAGNTLSPFQVVLFDDNGPDGLPGQVLASVEVTPAANGWVDAIFEEAVVVNDGEFYIAMIQGTDYPDCAPIAIDNSSNEMRSVARYVTNNEPWRPVENQNFMIRAYVYNESEVRGLEKYEVYRLMPGQEELPETWTLLANDLTVTEYNDLEWANLEHAWYRYAVKAVYSYNVSEPAFSNIVPRGFDSDVTINVRDEDGDPVSDALVILASTTEPDVYTYAATTPSNGSVFFHEVWNGMYKLSVTREGFSDYYLNDIYISNNTTLNVVLQSLCLPPQNFEVDNQTGVATWLPPVVEYETVFEEGFEGGVLPPGWTQQFLVQEVSWQVGSGGPSGTPANAHSGEYNATFMGSSATTKLITPPIDLAGALVPKVSFWHTQKAGGGQDELRVYYRTSATGGWVALASYISNIEIWKNEVVSLPNPTSTYYIAFEAQGPEPAGMGIALDDVRVMKGISPNADSRALLGFNLYLDGEYVDHTTDYTYTYTGLEVEQTYIAGINAEYTSCTSVMVNYAFTYKPCYLFNPPRNLNGVTSPGNQVALTWELPEGVPGGDADAKVVSEKVRTERVPANVEASPMVREVEVTNATRDIWDLQFSFPCADASGEAGAETDGTKIYTTKWNGNAANGTFFSYEMDGSFNGAFEISGCGNVRDLAYDGEFFYGSDASAKIWQMDFNAQSLVSTLACPVPVRAIAYDADQDAFYVNNWSEDVKLVDRSGNVINSWPVGSYGSFYGMAYDNYNPESDAATVWCFSQDGSGGVVVENNAETGEFTGRMRDVVSELAPGGDNKAGGLFTHEGIEAGAVTLGGIIQNHTIFGYELYGVPTPPTDFIGFNVYRNGLKLNLEPIETLGYNETITPGGEYLYNVTAVYEPDYESCLKDAEVLLCVGCELEAPQCILAEVQESDIDVLVAWCTPGAVTPEYWISYFTDLTHLSWSVPERATLFNVEDFGAEYPVDITQLAHIFYEHPSYPWGPDVTFRYKVYAADGATLLYESAEIAALQYPDETVLVLEEVLPVDGNFYVAVAANPETGMPSSAAFEDLSNSHGYVGEAGAWEPTEMEWATRAKIRTAADEVMLQPNQSGHAANAATKDVVALNDRLEVRDLNRAVLLGYNVWRNADVVAYVPAPDTFYNDLNLAPGIYEYCVTAIYDDGETAPICAEPVEVQAKGFIAGTVVDGITGTVINGAVITVNDLTATTDYDGSYELLVPSGEVEVTAEKDGYAPSTKTVSVYYDQTTTVDFKLYEAGSVFPITFYEPWDGGFEEQSWSFDPDMGNWLISTETGLEAPSVAFNWSPAVTNYSYALVSPDLIAEGAENVMVTFDLMLSDFAGDGNEMLSLEVFDGNQWNEVHTFTNVGNIDWTNFSYDISEYALGHLFSIRFVAHGLDTYNINYWNLDNVKVYERTLVNVYGQITHCATGNPIEEVVVTVGSYDPVMTDAGGYFSVPVEAGTYNISIEHPLYSPVSFTAVEITEDYELNECLTQPLFDVTPEELTFVYNINEQGHEVMWQEALVSNLGDGDLSYRAAVTYLDNVTVPEINPDYPRLNVPASIGFAPEAISFNGYVEEPVDLLRGSTAYCYDAYPGTYGFHTIDTEAPGSPDMVNPAPTWSAFAGDFDAAGNLYVIDAQDGNLKQIDLLTGDAQVIGNVGAFADHAFTGMACDKNTNTMYVVSTNTAESYLHTINLETAQTTVVGSTGVEGIIDIACDGSGMLYANCIVNDAIFTLDPVSGTGTLLGATGYDANYAQGMAWDPETDQIFLAAYGASGELRLLDRNTGATTLVGGFADGMEVTVIGFNGVGQQWLVVDTESQSLPAGSSDEPFSIGVCDEGISVSTGELVKHADVLFIPAPNVGEQVVHVTARFVVGVEEFSDIDVNLYPNPAKDHLNIELSDQVQSFRILNTVGQTVYEQTSTETYFQVNVKNFEAGAYLIEFTTNDSETFNKRFVVTK
ncbi:MAG: hypothetical protein CSA95_02140 [Bacteroidetes bacterium]|nr:MAG: hypothetical protein CSA95_02140 [Bacteroidota bacterium]